MRDGAGVFAFLRASRALAALVLVLCACPAAGAGDDGGVEVRVSRASGAWVSALGVPVSVEVRSRHGGTLRTVMLGDAWRVVRDMRMDAPAGAPVRFETPMFARGGFTFTWSLAGRHGRERVGYPGQYSEDGALICVNGVLMRELAALPGRADGSYRSVKSLPLLELPSDWQSYAGLSAMLLADAEDLRRLSPRQAEAMALWIKWLGGRLWVMGEGAEAALERIGLPLSRAAVSPERGVRRADIQAGTVFLQPDAEASLPWEFGAEANADPLEEYYDPSPYGRSGVGEALLRDLGGIRTEFIVTALAMLGVLMGPVNYLIARRRKNTLLLYVLTPACALLGAAAIVGGSFLLEGAGGEYNQVAILARHEGGNDAMLFDLRGVRSGFIPPELRFGAETLALPFPGERRSGEVTVDLTDGVALLAGWLRPRFATGYLTARPLVCRMNVEVRAGGGGFTVVNGLGHRLEKVAAVLPDGKIGWAESVAAGAEAPLAVERGPRRYEELRRELDVLSGGGPPFREVRLVARTEGVPYVEDGGLGGTRRGGRYYYVIAGDGRGGD